MPKTKISEFDSNPANNTDIDGINIAEGCAPSGINNAIRELMAQLKDQQSGTSGDNFTITNNSSSDALRITQTGSGNALVVEDSTNPDSTPFVVDASGNVIVGGTTAIASFQYSTPQLLVMGGSAGEQKGGQYTVVFSNNNVGASIELGKSRSATVGTVGTIVQSGDQLGIISFNGDDGTDLRTSGASIVAAVDGTPGTNDMPGRLVFSTTADGASSPTERMRIDSAGNVGIGGTPAVELDIFGNNSGLTGETANNTLRFTDTDTTAGTNQPLGKIEFYGSDSSTPGAGVKSYILSASAGTSGGGDIRFGVSANAGTVAEQARIANNGNFQFNSGYGSVATAYGCRAWVNFNGTGTVAIRASGNVSSITDNGTGDYTVNFTNPMPDANYAAEITGSRDNTTSRFGDNVINYGPSTTTTQRILTNNNAGTAVDWVTLNVAIFR